jgi:hypothetical protein
LYEDYYKTNTNINFQLYGEDVSHSKVLIDDYRLMRYLSKKILNSINDYCCYEESYVEKDPYDYGNTHTCYSYHSGCYGGNLLNLYDHIESLTYCPYCGKKIKLID